MGLLKDKAFQKASYMFWTEVRERRKMSKRPITEFEYKCDICGIRIRSDQLPKYWYQLNISVERQDMNPLYYDGILCNKGKVGRVEKTLHVCPKCDYTEITVVPREMELAVNES